MVSWNYVIIPGSRWYGVLRAILNKVYCDYHQQENGLSNAFGIACRYTQFSGWVVPPRSPFVCSLAGQPADLSDKVYVLLLMFLESSLRVSLRLTKSEMVWSIERSSHPRVFLAGFHDTIISRSRRRAVNELRMCWGENWTNFSQVLD